VERFFGTLNELERLFPSYSGQSIEDKPAHLQRNERQHKRLHNPWVPDVVQADTIITSWAYEEYAKRPHSGLKGDCPDEVWTAGKGQGIDAEGLRYLMMTQEIKTIGRNGIKLFGINFWDEALYGYRKKVLVRHDILDRREVYVYTEDGSEFICTAKAFRGSHPAYDLSDDIQEKQYVQDRLCIRGQLKRATEADARMSAANILPYSFPEFIEAKPLPMTPAQIEDIEAEASQTEVIHLAQVVQEEEMPIWEGDLYESYLEKKCNGIELTSDEIARMELFKSSDNYRKIADYYQGVERRFTEEAKGCQD